MIVSVSWGSPFLGLPSVEARHVDWGTRGVRRAWTSVREMWRLSRRGDDVLIVTAGSDAVYLAAFFLFTRRRLAVYDFLLPTSGIMRIAGRLVLWRVNRWCVVRRSDIGMLRRRFGVGSKRCDFVPFPAAPSGTAPTSGDYIYAAGTAYRDWGTFLTAADQLERPTITSSLTVLDATDRPWLDARALVPPEEGRALSAGSRLVVAAMLDTELPSGPVVVVDAMALGKAVIASDVGGVRDYIVHGETGWLVPAHDPDALAAQIRAVIDDAALLERVGSAAAGSVSTPGKSLDAAVSSSRRATREPVE